MKLINVRNFFILKINQRVFNKINSYQDINSHTVIISGNIFNYYIFKIFIKFLSIIILK